MFAHLKLVEQLADFEPLPGLPDLHQRYDSPRLFPVFANRVMPRTRPDFDLLAARVDLGGVADPFEVLARTGGRRATDRIEVFLAPERSADNQSSVLFFARGIRHVLGAADAVAALQVGDRLVLADDSGNPTTDVPLSSGPPTGNRSAGCRTTSSSTCTSCDSSTARTPS